MTMIGRNDELWAAKEMEELRHAYLRLIWTYLSLPSRPIVRLIIPPPCYKRECLEPAPGHPAVDALLGRESQAVSRRAR